MHQLSNPSILYFGNPVILISTVNENDSFNIAPISSVFWNGYRCVIGIAAASRTTENILRTKQCVINLPSEDMASVVDRLALTTGSNPVPAGKLAKGYQHVSDKFTMAGLTPVRADLVDAPLIMECPVQMEASLMSIHPLGAERGIENIRTVILELKVQRVHISEDLLITGKPDHVDPDKWRPLIMSFQKFYGLGYQIRPSTLARIPENLYRTADTEEAKSWHLNT